MCGRFTATFPSYEDLVRALGVPAVDEDALLYRPRWNVAPMERHWVVRLAPRSEQPELVPAAWGLLPGAGSGKPSYPLINARAETVQKQPAFRDAFVKRRCIVPVDGFYEWVGPQKARHPIWFHRDGGGLLQLAGLWGPARGARAEGAPAWEFTIVTTAANDVVAPAHDRMPVVIAEGDVDAWLHASPEDAANLLRSAPADALIGTAVSTHANKVGNDDPSCLLPWDPKEEEARRPPPRRTPPKTRGESRGETLSLFGDEVPPAALARKARRG
jgi:putative SOS response-associated peptidase YedK